MLDIPEGEDWVALTEAPLPVAEALSWTVVPGCGGLVSFAGTVRDFSDGREGVSALEYEAYSEQVEPRLAALCDAARARWPEIGRLVVLHRTGHLEVTDVAVLICASTPHRAEAFDVAEFLIDTLKATIPIWKRETWAGGSQWSEGSCVITDIPGVPAGAHAHHASGH